MTNIPIIDNFLKPFIGKHVWDSRKGHGSFLTFNLGIPSLDISKPKIETVFGKSAIKFPKDSYESRNIHLRGEQFIWVFCSNWIINVDNKPIAYNESPDKVILNAVDFLDSQIVKEININCQKLTAKIQFDLKGELLIWNNESYEPSTELLLLRNENKWLSLNNLNELQLTAGDSKELYKDKLIEPVIIKN
jgi:hypothetical protein